MGSCACGAGCKRHRLSDRLRAQLADGQRGLFGVTRIRTNGFCCPLCVRILPFTCATDGHAPSEVVGGIPRAFLCKSCNNFLGTRYEAGAADYIRGRRQASSRGGEDYRVSLRRKVGSAEVGPRIYLNATLSGEGIDKRIDARPVRRNPDLEKRFGAGRTEGETLVLHLPRRPSDDSIRLAFLSWVHLLLFAELGYAYVFSGAGRAARTALRSTSITGLNRAFFFVRGGYDGETEPVVAGVLIRSEGPEFKRTSFVGVAGEIGPAVVALPIDDDPDGLYLRLGDFLNDGSFLFVIPLATLFDGHEPMLRGIASYGLEREDSRIDRLYRPDVRAALAEIRSATGLSNGRRSRKRSGAGIEEPHWPPSPLELPLEPRDLTWRAAATRYLARRGVAASADDGSDESWIEAVRERDVVAARHLEDMRDLFQLGADRDSRPNLRFSFLEELNQAVADSAPGVRVTAFTAHATEPAVKPFASMACRFRIGDRDVVVGPHYRWETLVFALRDASAAAAAEIA
jgi:hypothetical protein